MTDGPTINSSARHHPCTSEEYHGGVVPGVSHSELEVFRDSPALYEGTYLTGEFTREGSDDFDVGIVTHAVALEGADKAYVLIPREVLTKDGKRMGKAWQQFCEEHRGKVLLKDEQALLVNRLLESIRRCPAAEAVLFKAEGKNEHTIVWECSESGVLRRARLDRYLPGLAIVDLKTCASSSPRAFSKAAANYGYARQADFYGAAIQALYGEDLPTFFVCTEKSFPFECNVIRLDDDFLALGREQNRRDLERFAACQASGVWRSPKHGEVVTVAAPYWAKTEDDWLV